MRNHRRESIANWIKYGIKSDDYDKLYDYHMSIKNCELCNVEFDDSFKNQRCLDHDHETGLYRKTLCRSCNAQYKTARQKLKCNNTSGHMWVINHKTKSTAGNINFTWRFDRTMTHKRVRKCFKDKTKCIALSFIMLLKEPF